MNSATACPEARRRAVRLAAGGLAAVLIGYHGAHLGVRIAEGVGQAAEHLVFGPHPPPSRLHEGIDGLEDGGDTADGGGDA